MGALGAGKTDFDHLAITDVALDGQVVALQITRRRVVLVAVRVGDTSEGADLRREGVRKRHPVRKVGTAGVSFREYERELVLQAVADRIQNVARVEDAVSA